MKTSGIEKQDWYPAIMQADQNRLKVLVSDPVSESGIEALRKGDLLDVVVDIGLSEAELIKRIPEFSALVVRSQTKVTAAVLEAATNLKAIGRAGVGVDNVDVEAATRRGVIVMNTPGGNTISTAEHAFSLMVSTARRIPQAHKTMTEGRWDRKKFEGVELYQKTLAILGMGRIGTEVAKRALAFGMRVLAYDPYLSANRARSLHVELVESLDDAISDADFITLHMPLTPETRHMLDARRLGLTKPGVRIVNCARGGLIDDNALLEALNSGHVAGAALDVYEVEPPEENSPLRSNPHLVMTPHLGASTAEAQENVGIEIAESIQLALLEGTIRNAVNMPSIDAKTLAAIGPYIDLGEKLGRILSQLSPKRCDSLTISYHGTRLSEADTTPITRATLKGFVEIAGGPDVNIVNAPAFASTIGLKVQETRDSDSEEYSELIEVTASSGGETTSIAGTFFGNTPRIVKVGQRHVEAKVQGYLLVLENRDRPGIVGHFGTLLGKHQVNIATMSLSRSEIGGRAITILNLDSAPEPHVLDDLLQSEDIFSAKVINL